VRVLLASDGSEAATRAGRLLADLLPTTTCDVNVLVVLSYSLYPYRESDDPEERAQHLRAVDESVQAAAEHVKGPIEEAGHKVTLSRRFGFPPDEIAGEVEEWGPDLVVMGRRGLHGPARWLGSVSEHVLHHARVPVLLVP
jgi:nucleotide-binding universal stress UspA family protein